MFEAVIVEQARGQYDTLLGEDLAQINDIIRRLEHEHWGDEESKFAVVLVGEVMGIYDDGQWEVAYRIVDDRFVEIIGLSKLGN